MAGFDPKYKTWADADIKSFTKGFEKQLTDIATDNMEKKLNEALDVLEARSQEYVPVDTGATKRSWYRRVETSSGKIVATFGYDEHGTLDYVPLIYINPYGTIYHNGKIDHWLEVAFNETSSEMVEILSKN